MKLEIPNLRGKELFNFLVANKSTLIAQKKMMIKHADAVWTPSTGEVSATGKAVSGSATALDVQSVINTTYWYDSHGDVHIDGIWKKSLQENRRILLLQEHSLSFDKIISRNIKAFTKKIKWRTLGVDFDGSTEALVFDSVVEAEDNAQMFKLYAKGKVDNHSVGMYYDRIDLALNDEEWPAHKELWDKHIGYVANRKTMEDAGWAWLVFTAKCIEGSAVPIGSNIITPTTRVEEHQPSGDTGKQTAVGKKHGSNLKQMQGIIDQLKSINK